MTVSMWSLPSVLYKSARQCIGLKTGDACECSEAIFYLDIVLDIKQLVLFGNSELYGYLALNLAGMALPPIFTTLEAIEFSANDCAEKDRLERLLSPTLLLPAVLAAIITQTLMAVLVALSAVAQRRGCEESSGHVQLRLPVVAFRDALSRGSTHSSRGRKWPRRGTKAERNWWGFGPVSGLRLGVDVP